MEKKRRPPLTVEQRRFVRDNYAARMATDIASELDCSVSQVYNYACKHGLRHNEQINAAVRKIMVAAMHSPEAKAKSRETHRRIMRMERFRVMSGERQKTRIRLARLPCRCYRRASYLRLKYNYFSDGKNPDILYYDAETRRVSNEDHYTRTYGLKFREGG